jgi:phosphoglycerate dehydrogenase-like enzyme
MNEIVAWTQWADLKVPAGVTLHSPKDFPLESSDLSKINFFVPSYMGGAAALAWAAKMPNLKILQMPNAGYDDALAYLRPGLTLCNATGVHDASTAELAVTLTLASLRGIPDFVRDQGAQNWNHQRRTALADSKVGIVGYGSIGKNVAKNLSGFEVEVIGFSRSGNGGAKKMTELDAYLPTLDVVILILPLNAESKHLFNKERLAKMKSGSLLVNVARGPIVDTEALVAELNSGRISAALDVTDPEPLPIGHPLWSAKNCLIVPHVGGNSTAFEPRCRKLVESQLELFAAGKPLQNVVALG